MRPLIIVPALLLLLLGAAPPAAKYDADAAARQIDGILAGLGEARLQQAGQVFKDVTISPTSSAERYLRLMDTAFARSLGVDCSHCHDPADWARDAKGKFAATRGMWSMMYKINQDNLRKVDGIDPKARINCTTCHRGQLKPATSLD